MIKIKYIILGLLLFVFFLLVTVPSKLVVSLIEDNVQGVQLSGVSGSVWNGHASAIKVDNKTLSDVGWSFSLLSLVTGKVAVDLVIGDKNLEGTMRAGVTLGGNKVLEDVKIKSPLDYLAGMLPTPFKLDLAGSISTDLSNLTFDDTGLSSIAGNAQLSSLAVKVNEPRMMIKLDQVFGNYDLNFDEAENNGIAFDILGKKDILDLKASGNLSADKQIDIKGSVTSELPQQLAMVSMWLKPDGQDRKSFAYKGPIGALGKPRASRRQ